MSFIRDKLKIKKNNLNYKISILIENRLNKIDLDIDEI